MLWWHLQNQAWPLRLRCWQSHWFTSAPSSSKKLTTVKWPKRASPNGQMVKARSCWSKRMELERKQKQEERKVSKAQQQQVLEYHVRKTKRSMGKYLFQRMIIRPSSNLSLPARFFQAAARIRAVSSIQSPRFTSAASGCQTKRLGLARLIIGKSNWKKNENARPKACYKALFPVHWHGRVRKVSKWLVSYLDCVWHTGQHFPYNCK